MEFIFELFAEMLGRSEAKREVESDIKAMEAHAEEALENKEQEPAPLNIFNIVNFH